MSAQRGQPEPQEPLPFGADIWTTDPSAEVLNVRVSIYGPKRARLYAAGPSAEHDFLWIQVGNHTVQEGATYSWEEFAEVLNEALRQRRIYQERVGEARPEWTREAER